MSLSLEFCEQRAGEAASAAAGAALDNVRNRELRSEAAWRTLATQIRAVRDGRKAIETARTAGEIAEDQAQSAVDQPLHTA